MQPYFGSPKARAVLEVCRRCLLWVLDRAWLTGAQHRCAALARPRYCDRLCLQAAGNIRFGSRLSCFARVGEQRFIHRFWSSEVLSPSNLQNHLTHAELESLFTVLRFGDASLGSPPARSPTDPHRPHRPHRSIPFRPATTMADRVCMAGLVGKGG